MKRKTYPVIFIPLILALGCMSLPSAFNLKLQNALAEKTLFLTRAFKKKKAPSASEHVQEWLDYRHEKHLSAAFTASSLSPFTIHQDAPKKDYVIAQVLYRNTSRWNNSLWINMGSSDSPHIKKNSPVLSGDSVIGVIDYVGKNSSCVQLITDARLSCSARVVRGVHDRTLAHALQVLQKAVEDEKLTFRTDDEKKAFLWIIEDVQQLKMLPKEPEFLAKGVLQGTHDSLLLKGTGFNYDFSDEYGPGRDLRTGAILQVGDLLVTTGMDGIFPEGLKVASVQSIMPLTEGAFAYELLATLTAGDLATLDFVTILPPQNFDANALPTQVDLILDQLKEQAPKA